MGRRKDDHGIENEPALNGRLSSPGPDPSEAKADRTLSKSRKSDAGQAHLHSVYDELAVLPTDHDAPELIDRDFSCTRCGYNLRGMRLGRPCPECSHVQYDRPSPIDRPGYAQWLTRRIAETSPGKARGVTLVIVLLSGFWSVLGAFWNASAGGMSAFFAVALWGPVAEEVMKIALIAAVIELRPYLFTSRAQVLIAAIGAGLMFAVIENLLYLFVYVPDPPPWLVAWRWTVCVALHAGCTFIAGLGAARVWRLSVTQLRRYPVPIDLRFLVAAIVIHGGYNGTMALFELARMGF